MLSFSTGTSGAGGSVETVRAACERTWSVEGELLSPYDLEATLSLAFVGGECGDCVDTSWTLRGRR